MTGQHDAQRSCGYPKQPAVKETDHRRELSKDDVARFRGQGALRVNALRTYIRFSA